MNINDKYVMCDETYAVSILRRVLVPDFTRNSL